MTKINWKYVRRYPESSCELTDPNQIKEYCMGGNAIVTLISPTKVHHTYYIRAPWKDDKDDFSSDIRFVYHQEKGNKWIYVGEIFNNGTSFKRTRSSKYYVNDPVFKGAKYVVRMMNYKFNTPMKIQHEGCCSRCGRKLTDPASINRGLGPKCYSLIQHDRRY